MAVRSRLTRPREGVGVAELEGLFASLDAGFDARLAHEEELAADDLALSLSQELSLAEALVRSGSAVIRLVEQAAVPLVAVGADYLLGGEAADVLVPAAAAHVEAVPDGKPVVAAQDTLLERLRTWVREARRIAVTTPAGIVEGRLARAANDHLLIERADGWAVLGLERVIEIRSRGG